MKDRVDLMIIGAQKAGTTSLKNYLGEHPQLHTHPHKEFSYFTDAKEFDLGFNKALKKYFSFDSKSGNYKIVCKNAGLYTRTNAIERLFANNPSCELVFILRNPVERAYSSYLMERNAGAVDFEFDQLPDIILDKRKNKHDWKYGVLIDYGKYSMHIENVKKKFPENQLSIFLFEELQKTPDLICRHLFKKMNVNPDFSPDFSRRYNVTVKSKSVGYAKFIRSLLHNDNPLKKLIKKVLPGPAAYKYGELLREINKTQQRHKNMNEEVRRFLIDYYKPYNMDLEKIIGKDLSHWND